MFDFVSEKQEAKIEEVPFFEDATAANGWAGQTTTKTIETLKANIIANLGRLGGLVTGFEKGKFGGRTGYRVHYVIETPEGKHVQGYMDAAALPLKPNMRNYHRYGRGSSSGNKEEKSLRMALYNIDMCLASLWKFERLSPGFAPLIPFMIMDKSGHNLTQIWSESSNFKALLPPKEDGFKANGDGEVVDGEVRES